MAQGEVQAIMRVPPAPTESGKLNANFDITPTVDGTGGWTVPGTGPGISGCWVTLTNYSAAAIRFCAGDSAVAAASATDNVLVPGATQDYWMGVGETTVRFRGAATPGVSAHRSSI